MKSFVKFALRCCHHSITVLNVPAPNTESGTAPLGKIGRQETPRKVFMESESRPSSPASTFPPMLGNSDYDEKQGRGSSVNYEEEQFESESNHDHEAAVKAPTSLSSSSDKYGSDEFEDDQEVTSTGVAREVVSDGGRHSNPEENECDCDTFKQENDLTGEQDAAIATEDHVRIGPEAVSDRQEIAPDSNIDDELQLAEEDRSKPEPKQDREPLVGTWCSKKIDDLRAARSTPQRSQPGLCRSDRIPCAVVESLIHRATSSRQPQPRHGNSESCPRQQKLKRVPASLMQRAQTKLWFAKLSDDSASTYRPDKAVPEPLPNSLQSLAHTFCSVKRETLLGKLATIQFPETAKRWAVPESGGASLAVLGFVQNLAAKQREVSSAANGATDEPRGKMLHRVAVTARLQLEDSIALRHRAATLLE